MNYQDRTNRYTFDNIQTYNQDLKPQFISQNQLNTPQYTEKCIFGDVVIVKQAENKKINSQSKKQNSEKNHHSKYLLSQNDVSAKIPNDLHINKQDISKTQNTLINDEISSNSVVDTINIIKDQQTKEILNIQQSIPVISQIEPVQAPIEILTNAKSPENTYNKSQKCMKTSVETVHLTIQLKDLQELYQMYLPKNINPLIVPFTSQYCPSSQEKVLLSLLGIPFSVNFFQSMLKFCNDIPTKKNILNAINASSDLLDRCKFQNQNLTKTVEYLKDAQAISMINNKVMQNFTFSSKINNVDAQKVIKIRDLTILE
ncbi:hypothetical protein SS50377_28274 [Spironucleus salmonicida]|uniref:Uncharacterized protein n=1 Tax=Spironucleus salmonicida TaxID=348837 RepID=V6LW27_9EUKA|nr:hypothetical protein SS50377_28274 [Spironucleus salmonicida]|eukprot:EST48453.1 Hypothetical protein SS50377_11402 [Spironucleus salmonicida]